jgi:hypothetical protein
MCAVSATLVWQLDHAIKNVRFVCSGCLTNLRTSLTGFSRSNPSSGVCDGDQITTKQLLVK